MPAMGARDDILDSEERAPSAANVNVFGAVEDIRIVDGPIKVREHETTALSHERIVGSRQHGRDAQQGLWRITLVSAVGSATSTSFTVTNSAVEANDTVHVYQKSGADLYEIFVTNVSVGSFRITFFTTGGTTTEQPLFHFNVIKGANS
jgi:hypothetical protein